MVYACLLAITPVLSQTEVSGDVAGEWTLEGSPYIVVGDVLIRNDTELVIEPGVEVLFNPTFRMVVNGLLTSVGTEDNMIVYTTNDEGERWRGIRIIDADDDTEISYSVIEFAETTGEFDDVEARGGGLYIDGCDALITHNIVQNNTANGRTAGIFAENCDPVISYNLVRNNVADTNGALEVDRTDALISHNIVTGNRSQHGGGIICYHGAPIVEHNTIVDNISSIMDWGAGLYFAWDCNATVRYNLIAENNGGGLYIGAGSDIAELHNNTIVNNPGRCGVLLYNGCEVTMNNCIVWGHNDPVWIVDNCVLDVNFSNIQDDQGDGINIGEGVIDEDPLFVDEHNGDYNLTADSPCRDTGDPDFPPDSDGSRSDMGCFPFGSAFELILIPEELEFGPVVLEMEVTADLQVILETDNEEFEPLELRFQVDEGEEWLSIDPAEDVIELNDTLHFEIAIFIPEGFDLGLLQDEIDLFVNDQHNRYASIPVSLFVIEGWGSLSGTVIDVANDEPLGDVEVRLLDSQYVTTTDEEGRYSFEILPAWSYQVCVDCERFHPYRSEEFDIEPDQDAVLDIELVYGECMVERNQINVNLPPDEQSIVQFAIRSTGSADLNCNISCGYGGGDVDPWMERFIFDAAEQCRDDRLQGVEFIGDRFYISGGNNGDGRGQIHVFTDEGEFVESFDQFIDSPWGMRDLAWDGNLLWGGDSGRLFGFTVDGEQREVFDGPYAGDLGENRALVWDEENGVLWICDIATDIVGVDLHGNAIARINRDDGLHIYGLSYFPEGEDGFTLYAFSKDGDYDCQVNAFNPDGGEPRFIADLETIDELKGGGASIASEWDPMSWVFLGVLQGRRNVMDHVGIWQISTRSLWMTIDNEGGVIPPGERDIVTVTLDSEGFPEGCELEGAIVIEHDGRGEGFEIPVIMTVEGDADPNQRIISLLNGWNMVSINVEPENMDVVDIFSELVEEESIVLVKDYRGRFYLPELNFNSIPAWDVSQGYLVKTTRETRLRVTGDPVQPDRPVDLPAGWCMVAYYPRLSTLPETGFSGIVDRLIIAKDGMGRFYIPEHNYNDIPFLCEGQGYQVKLTEEARLIWQLDGDEMNRGQSPEPVHYIQPAPTGFNMSLLLDCTGLRPGDEIAVFSSDGLLVGSGLVNQEFRCGLAVWGDDPTTEPVDGMKEGELFTLKGWNGKREVNLELVVTEGSLLYRKDSFAYGMVSGFESTVPTCLELKAPFPNPFNDWTRISFNLPEAAQVELLIFDASGRVIRTLLDRRVNAGRYSTSLHAEGFPNGVYIIRLRAGTDSISRKVLLMR